ncbi:nitroreductase [Betaproteobacteria bacterium]|nr:nitroreductase [Betaproteobacteria bacterium]GHU22132.1 nitroreductase [Betaproteobacteria bacterium]
MARQVENGVNPIFTERWSPRAFDESTLSEAELNRLFEAARWAPSAYNAQPWRFIHARRGTPQWETFLDFLIPYNRGWAQRASALVIAISQEQFVPPGKTDPISTGTHSYDTGAAVAYLALQAHLAGLGAHIVTGFDKEKARTTLGVPAGYQIESAIVIGKKADPDVLSDDLKAREVPNERKPLASIVAEGKFSFQ